MPILLNVIIGVPQMLSNIQYVRLPLREDLVLTCVRVL